MNPVLPPSLPDPVAQTDAVRPLIEPFADAHKGPRHGQPGVRDQRDDYRQKLTTLCDELERASGQPATIADLLGERVDFVLARRRDPRTDRPLRPGSRNGYRRIVRSFCTWLARTRRSPERWAPMCEDEPEGEHAHTTFSAEQVVAVLEHLATRDTVASRRLAAMLCLPLDDGGRRGDVLSLRAAEVGPGAGSLILDAKGGKQREVPLGDLASRALARYLAVRVDAGRGELFVSDDGTRPLTGGQAGQHLRRVLLRLGIVRPARDRLGPRDEPMRPERMSFQTLRRTFVKGYAEAGRSVAELAAIVGWDPQYAQQVMNRHYYRPGIERLSAVHDASSPLQRMLRPPAA